MLSWILGNIVDDVDWDMFVEIWLDVYLEPNNEDCRVDWGLLLEIV